MILLKIILQKLAIITTEVKKWTFLQQWIDLTWKRSWSRFYKVV